MLLEIIRKEAIACLPEALRMIPLEESHTVCETVKENMAFLGSSGPFVLPVARRELFCRLPKALRALQPQNKASLERSVELELGNCTLASVT